MREKIWDVLENYLQIVSNVDIYEKEAVNAVAKLFKEERLKNRNIKFNYQIYDMPTGCSAANELCVFTWISNDTSGPSQEIFFIK